MDPIRVQRTVSPIDGSVVAERVLAGPAEVDACLGRAAEAQRAWRRRRWPSGSPSSSASCRGWSSVPTTSAKT